MNTIILYLLIINSLALIIYVIDKSLAKLKLWRIPENMLLFVALIGGSIGAYFAMQLFRHKTLHLKFRYGIPTIFLVHVFCYIYFIK